MLCQDYKGKRADRLATRIAPALSRWSPNCAAASARRPRNWASERPCVEERKLHDASPAAITLALLLTDEEMDSLDKRAGDGEIGRADDQADQMSQALNRLRVMVSLPEYSPPMPRPPTGDRGWMA
jgi:hypothetical protein